MLFNIGYVKSNYCRLQEAFSPQESSDLNNRFTGMEAEASQQPLNWPPVGSYPLNEFTTKI